MSNNKMSNGDSIQDETLQEIAHAVEDLELAWRNVTLDSIKDGFEYGDDVTVLIGYVKYMYSISNTDPDSMGVDEEGRTGNLLRQTATDLRILKQTIEVKKDFGMAKHGLHILKLHLQQLLEKPILASYID